MEIPQTPVQTSYDIDRDYLLMCFGRPTPQCFQMVIHTGSFHMWVSDGSSPEMSLSSHAFNMNTSNSIERNKTSVYVNYHDTFVSGYIGRDFLYLSDVSICKIMFMLAEKTNSFTGYEGMIGLGYTPNSDEEEFSFVNQLYNKGLIFHRVFIQTFKTSSNGEITFGRIPQHIVEDYHHYGRCPALDKVVDEKRFKNKNWQCKLRAIYFGQSEQEDQVVTVKIVADSKVSFFSYRRRALLPQSALSYLMSVYFDKLLFDGICEIKIIKRYETLLCNKNFENKMDFCLMFDNWGMKIPKDKVFFYNADEDKNEFIFSYKKDYEKWSLGRPVVRLFEMVYDYENKEIGFYSKENVMALSSKEPEPIKEYVEVIDTPGPKKVKNEIDYSVYMPKFKEDDVEGIIINERIEFLDYVYVFSIVLKIIICVLLVIIGYVVISAYRRYVKINHLKNSKMYNKLQDV